MNSHEHIVFCFGRMNPPTLGHAQVFKTMANISSTYKIFVSQTQDKKDNPLSYEDKIYFIKLLHPEYADAVVVDRELNTVLKVASYLYDAGFKTATFVAGSDRVESLGNLLKKYNGLLGYPHGYYAFDSLDIVSSGQREDDGIGLSGVSGTKARRAAVLNNFNEFTEAIGSDKYSKELFNKVRLICCSMS